MGLEVAAVEAKSHERRMRLAGFPSKKALEEFDFSAQPNLDRRLVEELATLRFVEERSNVLFVGQPGVAKTMLPIALGLKAADAGHRVYYTTAADLAARTSTASAEGGWAGTMRFWAGPRCSRAGAPALESVGKTQRSAPCYVALTSFWPCTLSSALTVTFPV